MSHSSPENADRIAEIIGRCFACVVSGNNMPHMSGDPRNRIVSPLKRRHFDDACAEAAKAVLAEVTVIRAQSTRWRDALEDIATLEVTGGAAANLAQSALGAAFTSPDRAAPGVLVSLLDEVKAALDAAGAPERESGVYLRLPQRVAALRTKPQCAPDREALVRAIQLSYARKDLEPTSATTLALYREDAEHAADAVLALTRPTSGGPDANG